jgi:uncharacterized protein (TIGR02391 family)
MASRKPPPPPEIAPKTWESVEEIDRAIARLQRRVAELEQLHASNAVLNETGENDVVISNVRTTILEVFGANSPEYREHRSIRMWAGGMWVGMSQGESAKATEQGRKQVLGVLAALIKRLEEKREDLTAGEAPTSKALVQYLNLHPRIAEVAADLFEDGYHWEAVFAASKALVNYVKDRSGQHQLDGAGLVRTVFSRNNPVLAFNDLEDQTEQDEQEGMMHLFEGVVLGIRNPGGHSFPEGPQQRAMEYLSLISLLAYRTQEAKRRRGP